MADQGIRFSLSQVDQGLTISISVEVATEALTSPLQGETELERSLDTPTENLSAIRLTLQREAAKLLNEASERLHLRLLGQCSNVPPADRACNDLEDILFGAQCLLDFIEMAQPYQQLLWNGDRKTKVVDLPHFKQAKKFILDAIG